MRILDEGKQRPNLWAVWLYKAGPGGLIVHLAPTERAAWAWKRVHYPGRQYGLRVVPVNLVLAR